MATASIVAAFVENGVTCLEVTVAELGTTMVYTGRCQVAESYGTRQSDGAIVVYSTLSAADQAASGAAIPWASLTLAQKKNALTAAVKAVRDAQLAPKSSPAISGTVTV